MPNLSKNEWKDLDRELKPILAPWHEHLAIATSQNISEKLCRSHLCTLSWGALAVRSRARVCKILLNSNMLCLTYPVEHAFETAWPLKKYLKPVKFVIFSFLVGCIKSYKLLCVACKKNALSSGFIQSCAWYHPSRNAIITCYWHLEGLMRINVDWNWNTANLLIVIQQ